MYFRQPNTSTYTQMARAVGVDHCRAYSSVTQDYYRIKLYAVSRAKATARMLQKLFPEARVVATPADWAYRDSVTLYFDRK